MNFEKNQPTEFSQACCERKLLGIELNQDPPDPRNPHNPKYQGSPTQRSKSHSHKEI
jgi:hypothetical protein